MSQIMVIAPEADKATDKTVGANAETNYTLVRMAKNKLHYMQLASRWESGRADVRKAKKRFEEILQEEKGSHNMYLNEAWRYRPENCDKLAVAANMYTNELKQKRDVILEKLKHLECLTEVEMKATIAASTAELDAKIAGLDLAIATMEKRAAESKIQDEFPGSGGYLKQKEATARLREIERKAGGPMDNKERAQKFPELEPGWPDNIQGDEAQAAAASERQKASDKARQQEAIDTAGKVLTAALKRAKKAEAEKLKAAAKSKPAAKPVDRRHNAQPDAAEVRYVVQPGHKRPAAALSSALNGMPRNEGEHQAVHKRKTVPVDSDSEDDGAGALPPSTRKQPKQQKRAPSPPSPSLLMAQQQAEPFVPPEGQGAAYDILFRDEGGEDEDAEEEAAPEPPPSSVLEPEKEESDHAFSDSDAED